MEKRSSAPFRRCAEASGLVTREQIREAELELSSAGRSGGGSMLEVSDDALAEQLVELGVLNPWQASQLKLGRTKFNLGPYRILDSLGQGGMGQVFLAEHQLLHQIRAIKVLPIEKSTPHAIKAFRHEIRAQARLDHEHLVRAFDAGEDGNVHYLVSEYVPGADLRRLVRRDGPLDPVNAVKVLVQVADALRYAHSQGIIHRDVKPSNVLVTPDGLAKLSDLGLAGPFSGDLETDPRFGRVVGTPDFIAPDQIRSPRTPTPLWDVYSLGCTLYFAVTGRAPFTRRGASLTSALTHIEEEPVDPRHFNPRLDEGLVQIIAQMMANDPAERIATADEVCHRLQAWLRWHELSASSRLFEERASVPAAPLVTPDALQPTVYGEFVTAEESPGGGPSRLTRYIGPFLVFVAIPALLAALVLVVWLLLSIP